MDNGTCIAVLWRAYAPVWGPQVAALWVAMVMGGVRGEC